MAMHPAHFYPELTDDRLRTIATKLLDVRYTTLQEMSSPYDDNYTRESAIFGRSRNMLIDLGTSGQYSWLSLRHAAMDVTFTIERVPCRFFRDDHNAPEKEGFFKRNAVDTLFDHDESAPVMWRFVVEKAMTQDDEDRVYFIGYNVFQEKISEWMYRASAPMLHTVDNETPAAAELQPATVEIREDESEHQSQDERQTGTT